jgi:hypothetical protein
LQSATPLFRQVFPDSKDPQVIDNGDPGDASPFSIPDMDPFNSANALTAIRLERSDTAELLKAEDLDHPGTRLPAFGADFLQGEQGRRLRLGGSFVSASFAGGATRLVFPWSGWSLRVDGKPWRSGDTRKLDGGVHVYELEGMVPAGTSGALPLKIWEGTLELVAAHRLLPLARPEGWMVSYASGHANFKATDILRRELWPLRHVSDDVQLVYPVSIRAEARMRVPVDGVYEFEVQYPALAQVSVDGKDVYDDLQNREAARRQAAVLKTGQTVDLRVSYEAEPTQNRYKTLIVRVRTPGSKEFKPMDGRWLEPR